MHTKFKHRMIDLPVLLDTYWPLFWRGVLLLKVAATVVVHVFHFLHGEHAICACWTTRVACSYGRLVGFCWLIVLVNSRSLRFDLGGRGCIVGRVIAIVAIRCQLSDISERLRRRAAPCDVQVGEEILVGILVGHADTSSMCASTRPECERLPV